MTPEFWLENWKNNKIGFHQQTPNPYLSSFWPNLQLAYGSQVFVPLCGKSLDLLWLKQEGHNVLGVEISDFAAKQFFSENDLKNTVCEQNDFLCYQADNLAILQGDFFNLTPDHIPNVQGVFDRAALVALPSELRQKYVQHLTNILPDKAKILLVAFEYDHSKMDGPPFSVCEAEVQTLYQDSYIIKRLLAQDVLDNYPQFRELGLNNLEEKIYLLKPYKK